MIEVEDFGLFSLQNLFIRSVEDAIEESDWIGIYLIKNYIVGSLENIETLFYFTTREAIKK